MTTRFVSSRSRSGTDAHRRRAFVAPLAALALCAVALSACETIQQHVAHKEDALAAAGFQIKPANTPEREAMLKHLPPHKFVLRTHGDTTYYAYADPLVCNCLYVGTQQAYDTLKEHEREQHLADESQMTAELYSDPAWNWGAWGPWGPGWGGFGPGWGW
jgi:hypothetical protein